MEKRCSETCSSLLWNKDRVKELESNLAMLEQVFSENLAMESNLAMSQWKISSLPSYVSAFSNTCLIDCEGIIIL